MSFAQDAEAAGGGAGAADEGAGAAPDDSADGRAQPTKKTTTVTSLNRITTRTLSRPLSPAKDHRFRDNRKEEEKKERGKNTKFFLPFLFL
jgi:hypothetical protein